MRRQLAWILCGVLTASPLAYGQTSPSVAHSSGTFAFQDDAASQNDNDGAPTAPMAPPPVTEPIPHSAPFDGALWASGRWVWSGTQWQFRPGSWIARLPGYDYVNGYWAVDGSVWRWIPGGWARPGSMDVEIPFEPDDEQVATAAPPPPPKPESPPGTPLAGEVWAPGYWYWTGGAWVWMQGAWMTPPQPGLVVVTPTWVRRGSSYVFVRGGWGWPGRTHVVVPMRPRVELHLGWGHPGFYRRHWKRPPPGFHTKRFKRWEGPRYHRAGPPPPRRHRPR